MTSVIGLNVSTVSGNWFVFIDLSRYKFETEYKVDFFIVFI